jgi:hypothetical protein
MMSDSRKSVRKTALLIGALALAFYVGFILIGVLNA